MRVKFWFVLVFCFMVLATQAHAQRVTGSIKGTISDEEGGPLPGVTVTLKGEALIGGPQTDTTNNEGGYRFPALPPGAYTITYQMQGFQTVVHDQVRVVLGTTVEQNVTMKLSQVSEQMVIRGETPLVDPTKPGFSTNYTQESIENTPIARFTFFDFVQMAPASSPMRFDNTAYAHSILGSNTNENMYQMDGTDLTSALTGAAWPWPNTDIIEEIEILDIGAPAEYGNYQGAVINVVTKSGGNAFHGDANYYWQTQGLTDNNAEVNGIPYHRDLYSDFTGQLGGPILKDKLWFFAGFQTRKEHFSQPGTPPESPVKEDDKRYFAKVTYDLNQKNKLQFSYHNDYYNIPAPVTVTHPLETSLIETGNNPTPNVLWTSTLNDKTILEVRYAGFYGKDHGKPQNGIYASGHLDFYTGYYSGGILSWYDGDVWKSQVSGKVSYYADKFLHGDHDFRFGTQFTNAGTDYIYAYTNGVKFYSYGQDYQYAYFQTPYHTGATVNSLGLFADDTWTFNDNLTLNLGVRFDHSNAHQPEFDLLNDAAQKIGTIPGRDNLAKWNVVSPRLGFTYHFNTKRAMQLRGHYGRYYQGLLTPYVRNRQRIEGFSIDPVSQALIDQTFLRDPSQFTIDPNLKDPRTDQWAIGWDQEITKSIAFSASYVYKKSHDFIGTINDGGTFEKIPIIDPVTGNTIEVFNQIGDIPFSDNHFLITNPSFFHQEYNGLVLSVTKRMDKWSLQGSLTISKSKGLHAGSSLGPSDDQDSSMFQYKNSIYGQDPNDYINADGLLNGDRKFIFKIQGSYQLPWDVLLSGDFQAMSGRPYARQIAVVLNQGIRTIFAEVRDGSRRTDPVNLLDFRVEKNFQVGKDFNIAATADIFNVLNSGAFIDVATQLSGPGTEGTFGVGSLFVPPRRVMLGAKLKF